jgi:peroxiredoxin
MTANAWAAEKAAPDFSLTDTEGRTYTLNQFKGKVVVLNFITIWCQPCRAEMPDLNEIQKEYGSKGVQLVGICLNADPNQLRFFVKQLNLGYPILGGTDKVNKDYGDIMAVPTTFIINKQGDIVQKIEGARSKAEFLKVIKPLL